jgi:hypothetical protein
MPPKIACCISGLPSQKIVNHLQYISRYNTIFDFFIFFIDSVDDSTKTQINNMMQPKDIQFAKLQPFNFDARFKEPDKQGPKHSAFSMFYGISQVQKMRQQYEKKNNFIYDIVIRFRYDIHFLEDVNEIIKRLEPTLTNTNIVFPFHAHHIGICDQLWFGRSVTMNKFVGMFDWIYSNLDKMYFVNENVIYRFITAVNIRTSCVDIKYVLRRDNHIGCNEKILYDEYLRGLKAPWIVPCPEKRENKYQEYILNRNTSANTIYFLTRCLYVDVPCKIMNKQHNKFLSVIPQNVNKIDCPVVVGGGIPTQFRLHVYNCHLVNIVIPSHALMTPNDLYISIQDGKIVCTNCMNDPRAQFMMMCSLTPSGLLKGEPKIFQFVLNEASDNASGSFGKYLYLDKCLNICADGARDTTSSNWLLI